MSLKDKELHIDDYDANIVIFDNLEKEHSLSALGENYFIKSKDIQKAISALYFELRIEQGLDEHTDLVLKRLGNKFNNILGKWDTKEKGSPAPLQKENNVN